jgi:hypothetical protein
LSFSVDPRPTPYSPGRLPTRANRAVWASAVVDEQKTIEHEHLGPTAPALGRKPRHSGPHSSRVIPSAGSSDAKLLSLSIASASTAVPYDRFGSRATRSAGECIGDRGGVRAGLRSALLLATCETGVALRSRPAFAVAQASRPGVAWLPLSGFSSCGRALRGGLPSPTPCRRGRERATGRWRCWPSRSLSVTASRTQADTHHWKTLNPSFNQSRAAYIDFGTPSCSAPASRRCRFGRGAEPQAPLLVSPPSTWMICPVTKSAWSETRNARAPLRSSGTDFRLIGVIDATASSKLDAV